MSVGDSNVSSPVSPSMLDQFVIDLAGHVLVGGVWLERRFEEMLTNLAGGTVRRASNNH
jgi:hypothetical protein